MDLDELDKEKKIQKRGLEMQIRTRQELWKMQNGDKTMYNEWDFMVFSGYELSLGVDDPKKIFYEKYPGAPLTNIVLIC